MQATITGLALVLTCQATGTVGSGDNGHSLKSDACHSHLRALVSYHEESAKLEGKVLVVDWHKNGSVTLHFEDFDQHMWCSDEELHIDFGALGPSA